MKKDIIVTVFQKDFCWDLPTKAEEFMAFWQEKLNEIPDEHRDSAEIKVEANPYHSDNSILSIKVTYARPETDGEAAAREQREHANAVRRKTEELNTLRKLQEKYPHKLRQKPTMVDAPAWLGELIPCPVCHASEEVPNCEQCLGMGWVWSGESSATCIHQWDKKTPTVWICKKCEKGATWPTKAPRDFKIEVLPKELDSEVLGREFKE